MFSVYKIDIVAVTKGFGRDINYMICCDIVSAQRN